MRVRFFRFRSRTTGLFLHCPLFWQQCGPLAQQDWAFSVWFWNWLFGKWRKFYGIDAIPSFENLHNGDHLAIITLSSLLDWHVHRWRMTFSLLNAQVVIKTANLVFHIVVQGSGRREIIVSNYLRAARLVFPIRPITLLICCCGRCLTKSRAKNHWPVLFYVWTLCIVSLSYLLLSYHICDWESKSSIYFKREKKGDEKPALF